MQPSRIRKLLQSRPFKPFTIHVAELASYDVPHPDTAMLDGKGGTMVVLDKDGLLAWLNVDHITSVTQLREGSRRRGR